MNNTIEIKCSSCGKNTNINFDNCQNCGAKITDHPLPVRYYGDTEPTITTAPLFKKKTGK